MQQKISKQKAVKIITRLNNFSIDSILKIVKAAEIGQASYIDIVANPKIISIVKSVTSFPLCVSSIEPLELLNCVTKGADIVEIGNFDVFYNRKIFFSSEQIRLAVLLEKIGVSIIQTEGYSTKNNSYNRNCSIITSMNNASSTISSSYVMSKYVDIPISSFWYKLFIRPCSIIVWCFCCRHRFCNI
uniref:hypothetical protein n=1 Tax=Gracilaria domingensis TaxID=172961 RepID=UPI001D10B5CF|nr:hypothetical protein LK222_pgp151 [Gracilaria domingensis]UAD85345.1 hypothetical protein [Gracilaria domingensis]